jgi:hypothetical protein
VQIEQEGRCIAALAGLPGKHLSSWTVKYPLKPPTVVGLSQASRQEDGWRQSKASDQPLHHQPVEQARDASSYPPLPHTHTHTLQGVACPHLVGGLAGEWLLRVAAALGNAVRGAWCLGQCAHGICGEHAICEATRALFVFVFRVCPPCGAPSGPVFFYGSCNCTRSCCHFGSTSALRAWAWA